MQWLSIASLCSGCNVDGRTKFQKFPPAASPHHCKKKYTILAKKGGGRSGGQDCVQTTTAPWVCPAYRDAGLPTRRKFGSTQDRTRPIQVQKISRGWVVGRETHFFQLNIRYRSSIILPALSAFRFLHSFSPHVHTCLLQRGVDASANYFETHHPR